MAFGAFTSFAESAFSEVASPDVLINISGQEIVTTLGNIVIDADGNITIQTGPEIALDVNLGNVTIGLASFIEIQGQELTISQGEEIISGSASMSITGELANIVANTITVGEGTGALITGQSLTSNTGNITTIGNGTITANGIQINITAATLKFWDPITGNITETWTNIH